MVAVLTTTAVHHTVTVVALEGMEAAVVVANRKQLLSMAKVSL
jgi:hypothetical protein